MSRYWILSMVAASVVSCGAPRAAPLGGDIADVVERGIASGSGSFDHSIWDELVRKHAKDGGRRFDYAGLKADAEPFTRYLDTIASADLGSLPPTEIQALLINAYNAYTVQTVLENVTDEGRYEIDSIRDVSDVFGREVHALGGFTLSLDNIEHNLLRPMFRDPRFHFAVNCASISCPPLPTQAFTAEGLDDQLDTWTRSALRNPDYVAIDGEALLVTKIMDWYGGDFIDPEYKGSTATLGEFIRRYATKEVAAFIEAANDDPPVRFRDYEWGLNKP